MDQMNPFGWESIRLKYFKAKDPVDSIISFIYFKLESCQVLRACSLFVDNMGNYR